MKLTKSKQFLADAIHASGKGWPDVASWAAQDKIDGQCNDNMICFFSGPGKPACTGVTKLWRCSTPESMFMGYRHSVKCDNLSPNWHQTCLSREEYFSAYPEEPVADADGWIEWNGGDRPTGVFAEDVEVKLRDGCVITKSAGVIDWRHFDNRSDVVAYRQHKPAPAEKLSPEAAVDAKVALIGESIEDCVRKPTIEQLAADYCARNDFAGRLQQYADEAKADAEAKLAELVEAGKALGLYVSPITAKKWPELTITDRSQLHIGDVIWLSDSSIPENNITAPSGEYAVVTVGVIGVESGGRTIYPDFSTRDWRFIRRP